MGKKIVLFARVFNFETKEFTIGGIQTYIKNLAEICAKAGYETTIVQIHRTYTTFDSAKIDGYRIIKVPIKKILFVKSLQKTFNKIYRQYNTPNTLFILGTDQMNIKSKYKNVITIQHGIAFDFPGTTIKGFFGKTKQLQLIKKITSCIKNVKRLYYTPNTVCVDYNYYNWFRTLGTIYPEKRISIILNYSQNCITHEELEEKLRKHSDVIKIVFARRFVEYRGTLIFKNIIKKLLQEGYPIDVTFAGNGPLKTSIEQEFKGYENVHITNFHSHESIDFHKKYDIAVVPTIFSEGTSLSLCEAMASGCLPIATHVGGMTNMIIDNYNGYLCYPSEESLYDTLKHVLSLSKNEFNSIVKNSYNSYSTSFCKERWEKQWLTLINRSIDEISI